MHQIFSASDSAIFFRLLVSHVFVDFFLRPVWTQQKKDLYRNSLLAGVFAYTLAGSWQSIWLIIFISVTHGMIDYLLSKYTSRQSLHTFLVDQLAHVLVLLIAWLYLTSNVAHFIALASLILTNPSCITVFSGYLICTVPVGYIIGAVTGKWRNQLKDPANLSTTLDDAGKWIGISERIVIYSFVLVNQYEAIGFLITAKSLLRFREGDKAAKHSEYVLVGTLLSYAITILIGLLTKLIIE